MAQTNLPYPPEYKAKAVRLAQSDERSLARIASRCPPGGIGIFD